MLHEKREEQGKEREGGESTRDIADRNRLEASAS